MFAYRELFVSSFVSSCAGYAWLTVAVGNGVDLGTSQYMYNVVTVTGT